jgi:8-hydroxy-5-deazaflavin:NADPH oxidoreductase
MKIGIVGGGHIGGTLTKVFTAAGHEVAVANSRGPQTLGDLVAEAGERAHAATVEEAVAFGDLIVVALPIKAYTDLPSDGFEGKIVVDAGNYYPQRDGQIDELDTDETTSTELLAARLRGSRAVKAFNTMNYRPLGSEGRPDAPREQRLALLLAGDDEQAKATVAGLIDELGFAAVDTGSLAEGGRRQQPGGPLYNVELRAEEAEAALSG